MQEIGQAISYAQSYGLFKKHWDEFRLIVLVLLLNDIFDLLDLLFGFLHIFQILEGFMCTEFSWSSV
jgi:hypothetical protein